ncbi:hypothetical protein CEXT_590731 [Caerostris extrusa]|uniref:Uncharacterized protein n=1 Tax=Caerostris extrusa TaxID=172846 RepID=A0AAV4MK28_CAEEX|nr:hypothetical protein CEXT_590731 [Caerostris extrusa]
MDDHTYTREKEDAMEVTAEDSLSPFQDQLPLESLKRSGRPVQSPVEVYTMLQNIQNELSNDQEELASYQICVSIKSSSETPGMTEILRNAMDLVESKIACHLHKRFSTSPKRNTVKAPTSISPNAISTSNKFMNLDNLTEPDPPLPQAPKIPPIMVHRAENIKEQLKPIKDSFKDIKITLSGELFKIFAKDSDEHCNVTKFLQINKMDFYLITPRNERPIKAVIKDLPRNTPVDEIEQELSDLYFKKF